MLPKPSTDNSRSSDTTLVEREHSSRLSALSNFSIGDIFKDINVTNSKSTKFPEKLLKVLEQKLQDIAMGKDARCVAGTGSRSWHCLIIYYFSYHDQLVRRTMAKFYGQFMIDSFKRQMKENRKIEELILMFATHSTAVLKKEPSLQGDAWKFELNNHIALFVKLLRECLRNLNHVSPELLQRLDVYTAKLTPASPDPGYETSSSNRDSQSSITISGNVGDMQLVRIVASLFNVPEPVVQKEVDQLRPICTEKVRQQHTSQVHSCSRDLRLHCKT
jgi:hypothetical protein